MFPSGPGHLNSAVAGEHRPAGRVVASPQLQHFAYLLTYPGDASPPAHRRAREDEHLRYTSRSLLQERFGVDELIQRTDKFVPIPAPWSKKASTVEAELEDVNSSNLKILFPAAVQAVEKSFIRPPSRAACFFLVADVRRFSRLSSDILPLGNFLTPKCPAEIRLFHRPRLGEQSFNHESGQTSAETGELNSVSVQVIGSEDIFNPGYPQG